MTDHLVRAALSGDIGRRPSNQDLGFIGDGVYIVCDGMGGGVGGRQASTAVVARFEELSRMSERSIDHIRECLDAAQRDVLSIGESLGGMCGTTLSGVVLPYVSGGPRVGRHAAADAPSCADVCYVVNIGDSRTYHLDVDADGVWDERTLYRITHDHSERQEAIDSGRLLPEEAIATIPRNIITQCIGAPDGIAPDFFAVDFTGRFIICSDGLHAEVGDADIARIAAAHADPQEAADALTRTALHAGGADNITVVVVDSPRPSISSYDGWQAAKIADGEELGDMADATLNTARA